MERIVFAYQGGAAASAALSRLAAERQVQLVALTLDLGQGAELEDVRDRALAAGAARAHVLDVREEFARDFVVPALQAHVLDGARSPLAAALSRPLVARKLVEIAGIERADAVAYVCPPGSLERAQLDRLIRALDPALKIMALAPTQEEAGGDASDSVAAVDASLWGKWVGRGTGEGRRSGPASVELSFERGVPTAINGVSMPVVDLIASLSIIARAHGIGRLERVEPGGGSPDDGIAYEAPAAVVLHTAHRALQELAAPGLEAFSRLLGVHYAEVVENGSWFMPLRDVLDAAVQTIQQRVTGVARLELQEGNCPVVARHTPPVLTGDDAGKRAERDALVRAPAGLVS
jgi:argininosuccinate synthase